ncbi:chromosome segregation protein SMC [Legionella spiritensis]|uniref:chromosome segregation protein SMC n=1 Tax=Legionella spiritensis TaxID=452 RepID=UPI000F718A10|nr:chromosome segregation protein SMC [Legionella spiritensis]VEG91327.1 chromosome partition protein smc [Legionella spiritensis]
MHLKQLKLAGFKSFVDPTVILFPSQLVAVVGPNGCGKSNIIDAVRWVMGESSAKNLRGESMTDVIFSGSSHRKGVGQASVELLFDNSLGRLIGQYAGYQEISVKRVVTRDGDSAYFLNGTRCRRRDITDIFLGTGAGARGYSIIGQGTISRLIEARPEELRAYLEEAAGVSKYKERRRETVLRINHTRDNLTRVADIREELDKQLQRLERQAKAAERYQTLKNEERITRAEILALKWQNLSERKTSLEHAIRQHQLTFETHQANAAQLYQQSTTLREQRHECDDRVQTVQTEFYQLATEIARLEESVQQQQREKKRLEAEKQQLQQDWGSLLDQVTQNQVVLQESEAEHGRLKTEIASLRTDLAGKEAWFEQEQQRHLARQADIERVQAELARAESDTRMAALSRSHCLQRRQEIQTRLQIIDTERRQLDILPLQDDWQRYQTRITELQAMVESDNGEHKGQNAQGEVLADELQAIEKSIRQEQDNAYQLNTRQATLAAMLHTATGRSSDPAIEPSELWPDHARLLDILTVEEAWQTACEMIVDDGLQAIVVESISDVLTRLPIESVRSRLFVTAKTDKPSMPASRSCLADKIKGPRPNFAYRFDRIYTAETLEEAILWLPDIEEEESIVTPEGYWFGRNWLQIPRPREPDEKGLLARRQELIEVQQQIEQSEKLLEQWKTARDNKHVQISEHERNIVCLRQRLSENREALHAAIAEKNACERMLEQTRQNILRLDEEYDTLLETLETITQEQVKADDLWLSARQSCEHFEELLQQLTPDNIASQETLRQGRRAVEDVRTQLHQTELKAEREWVKVGQLRNDIEREQERLRILQERLESVLSHLHGLDNPDNQQQAVLSEKIRQHHELENRLIEAREQLQSLTRTLDELSEHIKTEEKRAKDIQEISLQAQMDEQALSVRATGLLESLAEQGFTLNEALRNIPADATVESREQCLIDLVNKINRLGAINLAAIEEFETESQRKKHLDEQYQDLQDALATLDAAIEKMDKETRQRFQTTFDEVNAAFQALFPRLFGGGHAMLELTCDNLLEAGVQVMAQPPGKRNSTIHLLSGGEKAMTAVALVFAIFQLNPSPFCMLDEVDAPLDDVNIGRFCTLVKEMSQFVQFLFITHNKVTMELADHLIGVTMREPGVSRVVAVDVEQALSMSGS